jgi:hypothetical protein
VAERKYARYVIDRPVTSRDYLYHGAPASAEELFRFYMGADLVPEATAFADVFWRTEIPDPNPTCEPHAHPFPQLLLYVGEEGTFEVEVPLEDELYVLTRTTAIWVPPGVRHFVKYNRIDRPMVETGILIGNGRYL